MPTSKMVTPSRIQNTSDHFGIQGRVRLVFAGVGDDFVMDIRHGDAYAELDDQTR